MHKFIITSEWVCVFLCRLIERKFKEGKKNAKKESFVNFARGYADSHNYLSNE